MRDRIQAVGRLVREDPIPVSRMEKPTAAADCRGDSQGQARLHDGLKITTAPNSAIFPFTRVDDGQRVALQSLEASEKGLLDYKKRCKRAE